MGNAEYAMMLVSVARPWCWHCGRGIEHWPRGWHAPYTVERAHICNKPRKEDRRAVILLCTLCHKIQHGERLALPEAASIPQLTLPQMLWLKKEHDEAYYSRAFLQGCHVGKLPRAAPPGPEILAERALRRPSAYGRAVGA